MDPLTRRSAIGIAAGVLATGVLGGETAPAGGHLDEERNAKHGPDAKKGESIYKFRMGSATPREYGDSSIREHKLHDFPISNTISASLITLAAGDLREPHWHPNSDEWLFVMSGRISMTIVDGKGEASQFECGPEDVSFTPQGFGHYVENVGDQEARLMLIHNHADFTTVNLSEWVAGGSTSAFASALNMPVKAFSEAPTKRAFVVSKQRRE
jgi:oxalate decarboxylase